MFRTSTTDEPLTVRSLLTALQRRYARRRYRRGPEREHWLRESMYAHLDEFFRTLPASDYDALEVSGEFYGDHGWRHYEHWHYPAFDLCAPNELPRRFGVVICDQVLEHVVDPFTAAQTLADACEPGGFVVVAVPFLVRVHPAPRDFWRFTPDGLRVLLERAGLEVVDVRSWGNRQCVKANFFVWAKRPRFGSTANEAAFPLNVWAIARKPGGDRTET